MSTPGAAWSRNGSRTLDAAATAPGRTLGVGAAAAAPSFGRGSFGHAVGLPPPPHSRGRSHGSVAAATTVPAFSIDGSVGGDFTSSIGPHASSQPWFDAAGGDPSSPGSWDQDVRPHREDWCRLLHGGRFVTDQHYTPFLIKEQFLPSPNSTGWTGEQFLQFSKTGIIR
ncbi:hypothetical protein DAI22_11g207700 [Oryza sativa Japonica Group]|nr:hypothetical protein DAI22_11g207700 [Oryza sativa Japonica Group]